MYERYKKKYFLSSNRVFLRSVSEADAAFIKTWLNDEKVTHFMFYGQLPTNLRQVKEMIRRETDSPHDVVFMVCDRKSGKAIGFAGIFEIHLTAKNGGFRILIGEKKFWNKGYGAEICALLTHYGFERLNLNMIYLGVSRPDNRGAIRLYEDLGYKFGAFRRQMLYRNSRYYDAVFMDMLRSEYYEFCVRDYEKRFGIKTSPQTGRTASDDLYSQIIRLKKQYYKRK